jgi:hypothetical protein
VHWTIDKQVAKKRGQIIFTALVFKSNVDWRKTLLTNTYYPEEKEIWLKDNSEVYVEKIEDLETGKIDEIEDIYPAD